MAIWNSKKIVEGRAAIDMKQDVAAGFLGITPEYLSMIENGKKQPSQKLIVKMGDLYNQPVPFFLNDEKVKLSA